MTHTCWISFAIAIILLVFYLGSVAGNSLFVDKPRSVLELGHQVVCQKQSRGGNFVQVRDKIGTSFCKSSSEDVKNA